MFGKIRMSYCIYLRVKRGYTSTQTFVYLGTESFFLWDICHFAAEHHRAERQQRDYDPSPGLMSFHLHYRLPVVPRWELRSVQDALTGTSQTASSGRQDKEPSACTWIPLYIESQVQLQVSHVLVCRHLGLSRNDDVKISPNLKHESIPGGVQLPHGASRCMCRSFFTRADAVASGQTEPWPLIDIHNGWSATPSTVLPRKCPSPSSHTRRVRGPTWAQDEFFKSSTFSEVDGKRRTRGNKRRLMQDSLCCSALICFNGAT